MTKFSHADKMDGNTADWAVVIIKRGEEENSTGKDCCRERAVGGRLLQKLFGTGLGALREKRSVAPAITV